MHINGQWCGINEVIRGMNSNASHIQCTQVSGGCQCMCARTLQHIHTSAGRGMCIYAPCMCISGVNLIFVRLIHALRACLHRVCLRMLTYMRMCLLPWYSVYINYAVTTDRVRTCDEPSRRSSRRLFVIQCPVCGLYTTSAISTGDSR